MCPWSLRLWGGGLFVCPKFQFRALSLSLQHFSSSSSWEACENYQFYCEDGFLCPPAFEKFWVVVLLGWVVEEMLWDVVLFIVVVPDSKNFSLGHFPCYLYNLVVPFNVSKSSASGARVLFTCFMPRNYSTVEPLSCFFVTSSLSQYIEIVIVDIELLRRRLQGIPKKNHGNDFCIQLKSISMGPACFPTRGTTHNCMHVFLCGSCTYIYDKYVQCFGANTSVQFLWIDIHFTVFCFMDLLLKKIPWNLGCCFFSRFNTSSHEHGLIVS